MLSFFKRHQNAAAAGAVDEAALVQAARSQARHRLVGAAVLVLVGIVAFPLLFETQPRPMATDIPIELAAKPGRSAPAAPASAPARPPRSSTAVITEKATPEPTSAPMPASAAAQASAPVTTSAIKPATPGATERPAPVTAAAPAAAATGERGAEARRAQALLDGTDTPAAPGAPAGPAADAAAPRFVVQAGAFGDAGSLRDARQKVEKLGLKTYTQVVQTDTGQRTRVRVGPFATREQAERAAQRIKGSGLSANVLVL